MTERAEEIIPNFKIRDVIPKLSSDATSVEEKKKLMMGIHEKFWHVVAKDMRSLLLKRQASASLSSTSSWKW